MFWRQAPLVRPTLWLIIGISLAYHIDIKFDITVVLIIFSSLFLVGLSSFFRMKLYTEYLWGWGTNLSLLGLGIMLFALQDGMYYERHFSQFETAQLYEATIVEVPKHKERSIATILSIHKIQNEYGQWYSCEGKVKTSFAKDSLSSNLKLGDVLFLDESIKPISAPTNPYAFDAQYFYRNKGLQHEVYIPHNHFRKIAVDDISPFWAFLHHTRQLLLAVLEQHLTTTNEYAVGAALLLGDKQELDQDVRNAYADTGAMHVLAVSGLHVGLIAWMFAWLLTGITKRYKRLKWLKLMALLSIIWLFALLTGGSSSVLRASTMFSFVLIGQTLHRQGNIYNTLGTSAFILLCIDAHSLFDVGFQLSYLAVLGIVSFQDWIYKRIYIKNKLLDFIWKLSSVSLAAQIATLPISLYYFHQFPVLFWLSGLIVIPMATIILPVGILLFLSSYILTPLATVFGYILYGLIWLMNLFIFLLQSIPVAVIEGIYINQIEMWLWYALIGFIIAMILYKRFRYTLSAALLLGIMTILGFTYSIDDQDRREVWIYDTYRGTLIDIIDQYSAISIVDSSYLEERKRNYIHEGHHIALGIAEQCVIHYQDTFQNNYCYINNGVFKVFDHVWGFYDEKAVKQQSTIPLKIDYLVVRGNPKLWDIEDIYKLYKPDTMIFDGSNSPYRVERWEMQCDSLDIPYYSERKEGAICLSF